MQNLKSKITTPFPIDWLLFVKSYLALAYIGIEEIKKKQYCKEPSYLWRVSRQVYDAKLLLIPIIWNIKHAIELLIKTHSITFQNGYLKTHKLNDLKDHLTKTLNIKGKIDDEKFDELVRVVDKYYKLDVFDGAITNKQTIVDVDNDILRYPEGNIANIRLDLRVFMKISNEELTELQDDIELINRRLNIPCDFKHLKPFWPVFSKR